MEQLKAYLLTIVSFIFITAVTDGILPAGSMKKTVKLLTGVVLAILTVLPVLRINPEKADILEQKNEYTIYSETIKNIEETRINQIAEGVEAELREAEGCERAEVKLENGKIYISHAGISEEKAAEILGISKNAIQMTE